MSTGIPGGAERADRLTPAVADYVRFVSKPSPQLEERLAVDPTALDRFVSRHPPEPGHVFGGLLVAQALQAARHTVATARLVRAVSASFLVAATGGEPIEYAVEQTRDGGSFATRRVVAAQSHGPVLVLTADFHDEEPGVSYAPPGPADVPSPEDCARGRYYSRWFDCRDVPDDVTGRETGAPSHVRRSWFRPNRPVGDDPRLHLEAVAYLSDHGPTRAARAPHAHLADDARRMSVSLDHSIWLHSPVRVDQWLLLELAPAFTGHGRGLSLGSIWTSDGVLVATVAQEVLLRSR